MGDRQRIALACSACAARNYQTTRSRREGAKKPAGAPFELRKFCSHCDKHTLHRESK